MAALIEGLRARRPRYAVLHFEPLAADAALSDDLAGALRGAGLMTRRYFRFGNWYDDTRGLSFRDYLARRPAALRNTFRRNSARLAGAGAVRLALVQDRGALADAFDRYEQVYAASWKRSEPYPAFVRRLAAALADAGALRLGLLYVDERPVAAQVWLVQRGRAILYKLAHDQAFDALSPGTVLTMRMLERLLDEEHIGELDLGAGDDAYKRLWATRRRERVGLVAFDPLTCAALWRWLATSPAACSRGWPVEKRLRSASPNGAPRPGILRCRTRPAKGPSSSTGALLVRGSALQVASLLAGIAVSFYMMPFLIHALGDRWYGIWALIGSITSYYALLDFGLTSAVTRFLTQALARAERPSANAVIVTGLVIFGGIGVLAFSISIAVALAGSWFFTDAGEAAVFRQAVLILGADVALTFPFAVFNAVLAGHYRFDIASAVQLSALAVRTALIVYFVSHGYSILALAVITLAVNLPSRLAVAVAARRLLPSLELSLAHFRARPGARAVRLRQVHLHRGRSRSAPVSGRHHGGRVVSWRRPGHPLCHRGAGHSDFHGSDASRARRRRAPVRAGRCAGEPRADAADPSAGNAGERPGVGDCGRRPHHSRASASSSSGSARLTAMPIWPLVILVISLTFDLMQMPSVSFLYASARHRFYAYLNGGEALANLVLSVILAPHYGMLGVSLGTAIPLLVTTAGPAAQICLPGPWPRPSRLLCRAWPRGAAGDLEPAAAAGVGAHLRCLVVADDADPCAWLLPALLVAALSGRPARRRPAPDRRSDARAEMAAADREGTVGRARRMRRNSTPLRQASRRW